MRMTLGVSNASSEVSEGHRQASHSLWYEDIRTTSFHTVKIKVGLNVDEKCMNYVKLFICNSILFSWKDTKEGIATLKAKGLLKWYFSSDWTGMIMTFRAFIIKFFNSNHCKTIRQDISHPSHCHWNNCHWSVSCNPSLIIEKSLLI